MAVASTFALWGVHRDALQILCLLGGLSMTPPPTENIFEVQYAMPEYEAWSDTQNLI